jgi:Fe-S oxidoreductase
MLTRNPEEQEELITQLWQKTICKLCKIQCSFVINMLLKRKKIVGFFFFAKN